MALRPAQDLDPRLSARHPLRKQRSAAGREPRPRADPPTATYLTAHTTRRARLQPAAVLGAWLLWTARGANRASPHAGVLSWVLHGRRSERTAKSRSGFPIVVSCSERRFSLQHPHHNCNDLCEGLYNTRKLLVFFIAATVSRRFSASLQVCSDACWCPVNSPLDAPTCARRGR